MPVRAANQDVTRTELVATSLQIEIVDDKSDEVPPLSYWLSKPELRTNLSIMILVWLFTVFNNYLLGFLVNTFDQIFYSAIANQVSELASKAISGVLFARLGVRSSLSVSFAMSALGGLVMYNYGLAH